ncbi:hypothetical protein BDN71DRAFT_1442043 [Pleurotus eryngii]|uniref:Uncharacterized protein n=1 Tax=Pleurotus eryngii TaxID=5323 RepID=A0A9P6DIS4_PLEER|nr:hypothetical protein BDN71DRAFT_1442043 [Pleurotus eryngii]
MLPFRPRGLHCQLSSTKGSHHVPLVAHGPGYLSASLRGPGTRSTVSEELRRGWCDEDVFGFRRPEYPVLLLGQTRSGKVLCVPKEIMYGEAQHGGGLHEAALFTFEGEGAPPSQTVAALTTKTELVVDAGHVASLASPPATRVVVHSSPARLISWEHQPSTAPAISHGCLNTPTEEAGHFKPFLLITRLSDG